MPLNKRRGLALVLSLVLLASCIAPAFAVAEDVSESASEASVLSGQVVSNASQPGTHTILIPVKVNGLDATILFLSEDGKELQSIPAKAGEETSISISSSELQTIHYKAKLKEEDTSSAVYDKTVYDIEVVTYLDEAGIWCYAVEASYNDGSKNVKPDVIEFENKEIKAPVTTPTEEKTTSTTGGNSKPSSYTKTSTTSKTSSTGTTTGKGTPKTGDPYYVTIYIVAMVASLVCLAFVLANKKGEKDEQERP